MSYYYGNSTILHLLRLWPTQHHMTQHCCLRLSESFHPNLVPFYSHSDGLSWWHLKLCVTSACICAWNSFLLSVRAEAAVRPRHRGRWKKRWRDNRVDQSALSGWEKSSFLSAHRRSVWDPVWSASMRSLQSPSTDACMYTVRDEEMRYYQVEQVSINQPGKNTNKHKIVCVCCCTYSTRTLKCWDISVHTTCVCP